MRYIAFMISIVAVVHCTIGMSQGATPPLDVEMFKKLSESERVAFAVSCLQIREQSLENFSYKLLVTAYNIDKNGKKVFTFGDVKYSIARSGDRCCLHMQIYKGDGKLDLDVIDSWDGKEGRTIAVPEHSGDIVHGAISDSEPRNIEMLAYNMMLGYRVIDGMSGSQFVRFPFEKPRNAVTVEIDETSGKRLLLINITERSYTHHRLWLDPEKGYMLVRYEYGDMSAKDQDWKSDPSNFGRVVVNEAKKIGDLWIPMKGTLESGCKTCDGTTHRTYEVQEFDLEKPTLDKVTVIFPPGSEIIDRVRNLAYVVQKDGSRKFEEMYDAATGKIISAAQQATQEAAATQLSAQPATQPAGK